MNVLNMCTILKESTHIQGIDFFSDLVDITILVICLVEELTAHFEEQFNLSFRPPVLRDHHYH